MTIHVWQLVGIVVVFAALIWAAHRLLSAWPRRIVVVLLVLFAVFLALASLGILPNTGVSVSP